MPAEPSLRPGGTGGEAVTDSYYFVHHTLDRSGSITVRVSDLVGVSGRVQPWAKARLIITESTTPGSAYAAVMVTGGHGVRMQYDYTRDAAATAGAVAAGSPKWLRLTRSGSALTGYASADGVHWANIGTAHLAGLPATVQAGLFVTSPQTAQLSQQLGGSGNYTPEATAVTAAFDQVSLRGDWQSSTWQGEDIGARTAVVAVGPGGYHRSSRSFTVTGSGDIAPAVGLFGADTAQQPLTGVFAGLILLIVVATMFITAEYRRGLIHTTFVATPRRGRVLAAKAIVIGSVAFACGAAAAAVAIPLGEHILRANGEYVSPTTTLTDVRIVLGAGALVALTAVLAVAIGSVFRRSAGTVCAVIALIVLPYVLAIASALPAGASQWLTRLTPAAAFAVQQTLPQYHQVSYLYTPSNGFYPLSPAAGLAVLAGYTVAALAVAGYLLRTRDAKRRDARGMDQAAHGRCHALAAALVDRADRRPWRHGGARDELFDHRFGPGHHQAQPRRDPPRSGDHRDPGRADDQRRVQHGHDSRHPDRDAAPTRCAERQSSHPHRARARRGHSRRIGKPARRTPDLPANGFTAAHGYPLLSLSHGPTLRAAVGSVLYLVLIGLFSLGIATAVRESASAIGTVLGLLYVFPILAHLANDPNLQRHLEQIAPMTAGLAIQSTTNLHKLPIAPSAGLAVLAGWATAALLAGGLLLKRRDA